MISVPRIPIYVTRPTDKGGTGYFTLSPRLALTLYILVVLNVAGWSIFGLASLIEKLVTSVG